MDAYDRLIAFYDDRLDKVIDVGDWFLVDQNLIDSFADVTRDIQWIHVDVEKAKKDSPYHSTIAHGFLTLSLLPFLTKSNHPDYFKNNYPGMSYRINYGLNKVRFPHPVLANSKIRALTTPISIEKLLDCVQIIYKIVVEIESIDKPACVAESVVRLYK